MIPRYNVDERRRGPYEFDIMQAGQYGDIPDSYLISKFEYTDMEADDYGDMQDYLRDALAHAHEADMPFMESDNPRTAEANARRGVLNFHYVGNSGGTAAPENPEAFLSMTAHDPRGYSDELPRQAYSDFATRVGYSNFNSQIAADFSGGNPDAYDEYKHRMSTRTQANSRRMWDDSYTTNLPSSRNHVQRVGVEHHGQLQKRRQRTATQTLGRTQGPVLGDQRRIRREINQAAAHSRREQAQQIVNHRELLGRSANLDQQSAYRTRKYASGDATPGGFGISEMTQLAQRRQRLLSKLHMIHHLQQQMIELQQEAVNRPAAGQTALRLKANLAKVMREVEVDLSEDSAIAMSRGINPNSQQTSNFRTRNQTHHNMLRASEENTLNVLRNAFDMLRQTGKFDINRVRREIHQDSPLAIGIAADAPAQRRQTSRYATAQRKGTTTTSDFGEGYRAINYQKILDHAATKNATRNHAQSTFTTDTTFGTNNTVNHQPIGHASILNQAHVKADAAQEYADYTVSSSAAPPGHYTNLRHAFPTGEDIEGRRS